MSRAGTIGPHLRVAAVIVGLVLLKLWLVAWQQVAAEAGARFDDELFLKLAEHLKNGEWLGPYNELTLIKGPVYPLWIAAISWMGLPLLTMQTLLHAAACVALMLALRRTLPNLAARYALFVALLFDPTTYESTSQRITREGLYTPLTMLLVACLIHLATRPATRRTTALLWCVVCGGLLGGFWLTREEGPWILPAVVVLLGYAAVRALRSEIGGHRSYTAALVVSPAAVAVVCMVLVALMNYRHYGVATIVELKSSWFENGYGALARVAPEHYIKWVPVPEPSRELAYGASPAFAELRVYLDGAADAGPSSEEEFTLSRFGEMTGTWFIWALRDAAASAGHHQSLPEARRYYEQIATEINTACAEQHIPCGSARASLAPPLRADYIRQTPSAFGKMADVVLGMGQIEVRQRASVGETPLREFYRDMVHMPVEGLDAGTPPSGVIRIEILSAVRDLYALLLYPLTAIGGAGLLVGLISALRTRTLPPSVLVAGAVTTAILARLTLLTYISLSSYPIYQVIYLRVLYPLLYVAIALGLAQFYELFRARKMVSARTDHEPPQ